MEQPSFFNFAPCDNRPPVRIRSKRNMILRPLDGTPRHVDAGEEVTVSAGTLDQLTGDDIEALGLAAEAPNFEI